MINVIDLFGFHFIFYKHLKISYFAYMYLKHILKSFKDKMRANVLKIPNKVSPQNISENNSIEMENAIRNKKKREKSSDNNNNNNKYSNHHDKSSYNNEELVEMVASRHNHLNVPRYCVPDSGYIEPAPNTDSTLDPKELRWYLNHLINIIFYLLFRLYLIFICII